MKFRLVKPVINMMVRLLCAKPYPGHRKGCPNFNNKNGCPPTVPMIDHVLDLSEPVWAVWVNFDLAEHRAKMLKLHPEWSRRKLDCCLYWQGTVRKELKHQIANFCTERLLFNQSTKLDVLYRPEAYGVNVTKTMKNIGVILEWPPVNIVRKIAFIGTPI